MNITRLIICSVFFMGIFADSALKAQTDYTPIDTYVRSGDFSTKSATRLTEELLESYETDEEKIRAIYIWVTDNIAYDFEKYAKRNDRSGKSRGSKRGGGKNTFTYSSQAEYNQKIKEINRDRVKQVLKSKKGVCEDYSALISQMCTIADIDNKIITGHGRTNNKSIGKKPKPFNHAWNAVKLDGQWLLMDATWGSGGAENGELAFTKNFKEGFFMEQPEDFIKNHFPENVNNQFLKKPVTPEEFAQFPFISFGYFIFDVKNYSPAHPTITAADELVVELWMDENVHPNDVRVMGRKKEISATVTNEGNHFTIRIDMTSSKSRYISIGVKEYRKNFEEIIAYKVI